MHNSFKTAIKYCDYHIGHPHINRQVDKFI
ncbi:MAG: hypothetical protein ACJA1A_001887 [Saprospiraceae bacterium]|jgi:hypothetical protein